MSLNAGELDRRITLQTGSATPDSDYGGPSEATATLATRWAKVRPLSASEKAAAGMDVGTAALEFTVRWDSTVDAALDSADRISYDSRSFDIRGVTESDEGHVALVILAEEKR